jgi:hypothetical protein
VLLGHVDALAGRMAQEFFAELDEHGRTPFEVEGKETDTGGTVSRLRAA